LISINNDMKKTFDQLFSEILGENILGQAPKIATTNTANKPNQPQQNQTNSNAPQQNQQQNQQAQQNQQSSQTTPQDWKQAMINVKQEGDVEQYLNQHGAELIKVLADLQKNAANKPA
jgi:FtsZ-interacting cell division protein ZipA